MKLKYFVEFSEIIEDVENIDSNTLSRISNEIKAHLYNYLKLGDFNLHNDEIKLEFDLEGLIISEGDSKCISKLE